MLGSIAPASRCCCRSNRSGTAEAACQRALGWGLGFDHVLVSATAILHCHSCEAARRCNRNLQLLAPVSCRSRDVHSACRVREPQPRQHRGLETERLCQTTCTQAETHFLVCIGLAGRATGTVRCASKYISNRGEFYFSAEH